MSSSTPVLQETEQALRELRHRMAVLEEAASKQRNAPELEQVLAENKKLRTENAKLQYRVKHLIRSLNEEEKGRTKVKKLEYRVHHLVKSLSALDGSDVSTATVVPNSVAASSLPDPIDQVVLTVGQIKTVKVHPKANRLLMEEIDVGESEPRTICSGIRQYYTPESLEGKLVVVVANLLPRKLVLPSVPFPLQMGIFSHGMLLCSATEDHSKVEIMEPPAGSRPGERLFVKGVSGECLNAEGVSVLDLSVEGNAWSVVQPKLKTNVNCVGTYDGKPLETSVGAVRCQSLTNSPLS